MWAEDVTCQDCHLVEAGVVRRSAELCADCHDEDYPDMVSEWRGQIEALLGSLPKDRFDSPIEWLTSEGSFGGHNPQAVIDYLDKLVQLLPRP